MWQKNNEFLHALKQYVHVMLFLNHTKNAVQSKIELATSSVLQMLVWLHSNQCSKGAYLTQKCFWTKHDKGIASFHLLKQKIYIGLSHTVLYLCQRALLR